MDLCLIETEQYLLQNIFKKSKNSTIYYTICTEISCAPMSVRLQRSIKFHKILLIRFTVTASKRIQIFPSTILSVGTAPLFKRYTPKFIRYTFLFGFNYILIFMNVRKIETEMNLLQEKKIKKLENSTISYAMGTKIYSPHI